MKYMTFVQLYINLHSTISKLFLFSQIFGGIKLRLKTYPFIEVSHLFHSQKIKLGYELYLLEQCRK